MFPSLTMVLDEEIDVESVEMEGTVMQDVVVIIIVVYEDELITLPAWDFIANKIAKVNTFKSIIMLQI